MKQEFIVERNGELVEVEGAVKLTNDKLIGGWAKIYRGDRDKPITTRISLEEFSKGQATWKQMPLNMIRKSAIVNAQREAFPETLGALYTEDDALTQTTQKDVQATVQEEVEEKANQTLIDISQKVEEPNDLVADAIVVEDDIPAVNQQEMNLNDGPAF